MLRSRLTLCHGKSTFEKPGVVNLLLLTIIIVISLIGGILFNVFEKEASEEDWNDLQSSIINCTLNHLRNNSYDDNEQRSTAIFENCINESLPKTHWSVLGGSIFSFASITTLGFGAYEINTQNGRLFYIFYCLIGMPLGLLLLANTGQFMQDGAAKLKEKLEKWDKERRERNKKKKIEALLEKGLIQEKEDGEEDEEEFEMSGLLLLLIFAIYISAGVVVLMFFNGANLVDGIYYNFLGFSGVDFDAIVSLRLLLFPICILYVIGGLALGSLAFQLLGRLLQQLHHLGQKLTYSGRKKIWFGGKRVTVKDFARVLGKQWGVAKEKIENIDDILDEIVQYQIDVQEGNAEPIPYPQDVIPFVPPKTMFGEEIDKIGYLDDYDNEQFWSNREFSAFH